MKKTYRIEVDCANCASLMENALGKIKGIENVAVNFMTQKMNIEFAEGQDINGIMERVIRDCKKIDGDFELFM